MVTRKGTSATTAPKARATPPQRASAIRAAERKRSQRRRAWGVTIAAAALIVGVVIAAANLGGGGGTGVTAAESFDLPRLGESGRVTLASTVGKPTIVNMFASWCDQCEAELPTFHAAATALKGKVNFVFVNSNETGNWQSMANRHHLFDFPVAKDIGGSLDNGLYRSLGGTGGMPMTAFYDADGKLIDVARGALVGDSLKGAIAQVYGVTY
ncbi:MAG: TlpA family protein disulfide reductase [Acidimicrobiia bacterium]